MIKTLKAASVALAAGGALALTAAPAHAEIEFTEGACSAVQSDDGHQLYVDLCGTDAPGTQWRADITVCNSGGCRLTRTPYYPQGKTVPFSTSGYISGVSWEMK